jgi:hypothetical protein
MNKFFTTLFVITTVFCFSQTTTITNLNKILSHLKSSYEGVSEYGVKVTYIQKNSKFALNAAGTKLTYSWETVNSSTYRKVESYSYEANISDIDFSRMEVRVQEDNGCIIMIDQIQSKTKKFIQLCTGTNCTSPKEYSNNFGIVFSAENCGKYHEEFLNLFKKLKPKG